MLSLNVETNMKFEIFLGIGVEKSNPWAFDTTQFDNILKKLKVVVSFTIFSCNILRFMPEFY